MSINKLTDLRKMLKVSEYVFVDAFPGVQVPVIKKSFAEALKNAAEDTTVTARFENGNLYIDSPVATAAE